MPTIVKREYDRMVNAAEKDVIISSCCHSVNLLIQKHYPDALPYLAHVLSPMQAHCQELKRRYPGAKTVFIGPCIAKKDEAEGCPELVDCVLTFEELAAWLREAGVIIAPDPERNEESRARLFPTTAAYCAPWRQTARSIPTSPSTAWRTACIRSRMS